MLENNCAQLNETDCLGVVRDDMVSSTVGGILISRIKEVKIKVKNNRINGKDDTTTSPDPIPQRPQSNYYVNKGDVDPFPNLSLINLPDQDQNASGRAAMEDMLADILAQ